MNIYIDIVNIVIEMHDFKIYIYIYIINLILYISLYTTHTIHSHVLVDIPSAGNVCKNWENKNQVYKPDTL